MYNAFKILNYPDSLVSPELFARLTSRMYTGDVVDGFTVTPGTGLKVVLAPGNALVRYGSGATASARIVSLVDNFELSIETPDVSNPRIDLVVLYVDNDVELPDDEEPSTANLDGPGVAKAKIVKGAASSNPTAPNATAIQASVGAGNPYTVLYEVRVNQGVSLIAEDKVTDVRVIARVKRTGAVAFTAFRNTAWSLPNNSTVKVALNAVEFDNANSFDVANSRWVVKRNGFYNISAGAGHNDGASTRVAIFIGINGSNAIRGGDNSSAFLKVGISKNMYLTAGTEVDLRVYCGASRTGDTDGSITWLSVNEIVGQ